ncbi:MAG: glyoxalase [Prolixibacteraceae bacterium]|nr:glyoxalase [Prolixibacteraceae bacterium]MBT6005535.1 glyoxalase [Prolixibacteraceae bacterium]MBT6764205.1 glyoxalase [Prolixibacteraceae bacterium]MBT6999126.1 glyoxalase [Prolixibacteraceae bacterium]MBT7396080.1 glyoxalase [Prolixibacteraceae bacterium]
MKIKMTGIFVEDPISAFKFYTEILGFKKLIYMPEAYLAIVVSPEDEKGTALLLEPNSNPIAKTYQENVAAEKLPVIVFGVENVQKEYERLIELGVQFINKPETNEWGTTAVFDDTCGNFIQIHQD